MIGVFIDENSHAMIRTRFQEDLSSDFASIVLFDVACVIVIV